MTRTRSVAELARIYVRVRINETLCESWVGWAVAFTGEPDAHAVDVMCAAAAYSNVILEELEQ